MDNFGNTRKRIRGVQPVVQEAARTMRRALTPAERVLWQALRGKQLDGLRFRKQHPVGKFVLDFSAPLHHLVVELDGSIHAGQEERDAERTALLQAYGYRVIRCRNDEVFNDLPGVLKRILQAASIIESGEETS